MGGCGGSSTWEKPSNYKNPEINAFELIEWEEKEESSRKKI